MADVSIRNMWANTACNGCPLPERRFLTCTKKREFHGDGKKYLTKQAVKDRPACTNCHKTINSKTLLTKKAHSVHRGKVSCYGCHSGGQYRNCYDCHEGTGAKAEPGFILGKNPRNTKEVTTLRVIRRPESLRGGNPHGEIRCPPIRIRGPHIRSVDRSAPAISMSLRIAPVPDVGNPPERRSKAMNG